MTDSEYGFGPNEGGSDKLFNDLRDLSAEAIGLAASGHEKYMSGDGALAFHDAERRALAALELSDRAASWEDLRRSIHDLIEGEGAPEAWKAQAIETRHRAEMAALGAALAVSAEELIDREQFIFLARPLADALPWLG
ncbi:MAG: hypothetical protein ACR2MY_07735 [Candidatus Dormibacteria bacterium]